MDEIEAGFTKLMEKIDGLTENTGNLAKSVKEHDADLLARMAVMTIPVIRTIGLDMLEKGKQDSKGELYDTVFFTNKMIVLGKTDPVKYRPDDVTKKVDDQFCLLSENGQFYELMYSSEGITIDSYLHPLTAHEVLDIYGYDIMYMVYRAMKDYLANQEELLAALEKVMNFIFGK